MFYEERNILISDTTTSALVYSLVSSECKADEAAGINVYGICISEGAESEDKEEILDISSDYTLVESLYRKISRAGLLPKFLCEAVDDFLTEFYLV